MITIMVKEECLVGGGEDYHFMWRGNKFLIEAFSSHSLSLSALAWCCCCFQEGCHCLSGCVFSCAGLRRIQSPIYMEENSVKSHIWRRGSSKPPLAPTPESSSDPFTRYLPTQQSIAAAIYSITYIIYSIKADFTRYLPTQQSIHTEQLPKTPLKGSNLQCVWCWPSFFRDHFHSRKIYSIKVWQFLMLQMVNIHMFGLSSHLTSNR